MRIEMMASYKINVVIEKDQNGYYAFCPELEGCHTHGHTMDEVMANVNEAAQLYLETLTIDERLKRLRATIV